jgi:hypothetical protein
MFFGRSRMHTIAQNGRKINGRYNHNEEFLRSLIHIPGVGFFCFLAIT